MGPVRSNTQKLRMSIINDYYELGLSYAELAKKYGYSTDMVKKTIARDRLENGPRDRKSEPVDPRRRGERKALSYEHFCIGLHVARHIKDNGITPTIFGRLGKLAASRVRVGQIIDGVHDLTLLERDAIAEIVGVTKEEVVEPPKHEEKVTHDY